MTIVETRPITGGVDTHLDVHVAAALDPIGGVLGVESFEGTSSGYRKLFEWLSSFGELTRVGVEGTGAYGAGLARLLRSEGVEVVEVDRPNRQARRLQGKSDPVEAARAAQSGRARGVAKTADGNVEAIRALLVAKRSAREARITTQNQIRHLTFAAPDELRERLKSASRATVAAQAAALRPRRDRDPVLFATKTALRILGRRVLSLAAEADELDVLLAELVTATAPELLDIRGVGVDTAAILSRRWATTPNACAQRARSLVCVVWHRSRRPRARSPDTG